MFKPKLTSTTEKYSVSKYFSVVEVSFGLNKVRAQAWVLAKPVGLFQSEEHVTTIDFQLQEKQDGLNNTWKLEGRAEFVHLVGSLRSWCLQKAQLCGR